MRLAISVAIACVATLGGCIIIDAHKESTAQSTTAPAASNDLTSREIDAAAKLAHEPERVEALGRIAKRPGLRPDSQARVVWAAYMRLSSDDGKVNVIRTVIDSPEFSADAKWAVLEGLHRYVSIDSNRALLLEAVSKKG
jgi:hypothetical protein